MRPTDVFLSLGSNLGDREANLERALAALAGAGMELVARSSVYETAPQDVTDQPWFLNMAAACRTMLYPRQLLAAVNGIERLLGRRRTGAPPRGPRVIDIDILLYGQTVIESAPLTIPHPRMRERRFVLEPLLEIAPELRDPVSGRPWSEALGSVRGQALRKKRA